MVKPEAALIAISAAAANDAAASAVCMTRAVKP